MNSSRIPILAGNWKMHLTIAEATALAVELRAGCAGITGREVIVAPVFTALAPVAAALAGSPIRVAAQHSHGEEKGAYTGATTRQMSPTIRPLTPATPGGVGRMFQASFSAPNW